LLAILAVRKQRGQGLLSGWCQASTSTGDLNRSKAGARRSIHISIGSNVVAWTTIIFCLLIFLIFGLIEWPGLHWDASLFATPVLNVATGEGWIFGGLPLHLVSHISQTYNIHGILHVLVFGSLLQSSSWEKYFFWCGLINAATFLSWTLIFRRALERKGYPGLLRPILFGLMAGVIALGLQGRPEHMAPLLISLPLIMRQLHLPTRSVQLTEYALIGLLFTLSPASGVLYGMGVLLWISYNFENSNNPRFWRELAIAGLSSVTAVLIVIGLLSPLSIREWAENILMASGKALDFSSHLLSFDLGTLAGVSMSAPLWNVIVLTTGLCIFFLLVRRRMFVGLLAFAILIPYLYPRLTTYGYAPFFPLIFLIFISTNECSEISIFKSHGKNQAVNIGSVVAGFYTLVFVNMVALSLLYVFQGTSLLEARRKLDDLGIDNISKNQATVFNSIYRPSFIVFGNGGDRFIAGTQTHDEPRFDENLIKYEAKFRRKIEYFVYPQVYVGQPPDEVVVGADQFEIIYDGWKMESPRFFGVKFWGPMPMPGYQFSLYQRIKVPIH
jgi:hypothetical protein